MKDILLSVIVPVYNVEKYLGECLESLVNQSLKDMEIIIVNDGTKDNSQAIIDEYKEKYPDLIQSLIKDNGGLSSARNYGIPYAKGKYITFLDSDDYIETNLYENMILMAEKDSLDLVVADLEYFYPEENKPSFISPGLNRVTDSDLKSLFISPLFSWNKIYRRNLFEELECRYPVGLWYEDIPVTLRYFSEIKKVGYYEGSAYHYRQRKTSILGSGYNDKMFDIFTIFERVEEDFQRRNCLKEYHNELEYLFVEHFLVYGAFRFLRTDHYKELMSKGFDFVKKYFPDYKKNPYIHTLGKKNMAFLCTNNKLTMHFWHWYLTK